MLLIETLPLNLETLDLVHCNDESTLDRLLLSLEQVLFHKAERFPSLRKVSIQTRSPKAMNTRIPSFVALPWKQNGVRFIVRQVVQSQWRTLEEDESQQGYLERNWGWDEDIKWTRCTQNYASRVETHYDSQACVDA